jgi:hypothetical protein
MITVEMFINSFYLLAFFLALDRKHDEEIIIQPRQGNESILAHY